MNIHLSKKSATERWIKIHFHFYWFIGRSWSNV